MPSIEEFKAAVTAHGGLAAANRFRVEISLPESVRVNYPDIKQLNLLCDTAILPGRQINTFDYVAQKQAIKMPNGFVNEDVSFTFLLTNDYYAKRVFDAWMGSVIDFNGYRAMYWKDYVSNITVYQQSKGNNTESTPPSYFTPTAEKDVKGVKLINAYPISISGIGFDNSAENTIQKLTVSFAYENFVI